MKIVFVRHGHPDYHNDCLTELGHLQAEAAAQRLEQEGIEEIYSSTRGDLWKRHSKQRKESVFPPLFPVSS